jgi:serine/threonine-protein kinase HipA
MQFTQKSQVEIFRNGQWMPAAELRAVGIDRCRFEYLADYIFGADPNPPPIAHGLPVGFFPAPQMERGGGLEDDLTPPSFIYDLVPQGRGRQFLLKSLNVADTDSLTMPLVMAGAFNPIGNIRLTTAVDFFQGEIQRMREEGGASMQGFALEDILQHSAEYLDHIGMYAMLAAGTTGVQGVAPKFLLATDPQGQWFADLALADSQAHAHWLLKLPRGRAEDDRAVLRNEAPYLRVAQACGLRVHAAPMLKGELLFLRRFDRVVNETGLHRLPQESLASVIGMTGPTQGVAQNALLAGLRRVASDPLAETIEYAKRDVLNLALRNTDNHARNSAVQTTLDGRVQLTPLFDFAPMFKDSEVIARSCHWEDAQRVRQKTWLSALQTLQIPDNECGALATALYGFAETVAAIPTVARDEGVEPDILEQCRRTIDLQAEQLLALKPLTQ